MIKGEKREMKQNKKALAIAMLLTLTISLTLVTFPTNAAISKKTYPFIGAMPNPVGVGQEVLLHFGISDPTVHPQEGWEGITVTVTKPDGTTQTLGPFKTDTTGGTGFVYQPTTAGTYYLQTHFPEQILQYERPGRTFPAGTIMLASDSEKLTLTVTQEPREYFPNIPLPSEFWTRPINSQFRDWYTVAGNWLATPPNRYAPYNDAPESPHILWVTQLAEGGLVGGDLGPQGYETGDAYEGKFTSQIILNGVLYFCRQIPQTIPAAQNTPMNTTTLEQQTVAVDLKTGKELWNKVLGDNERIAFGQQMYWKTMNMYGAFAYIWTVTGSTWKAYDPLTGRWEYTMINVPSGTRNYGPNGEILIYTLNQARGWMTQWNSTSVVYKTYLNFYLNSRNGDDVVNAYYYSQRWRPQGITFDCNAPFNVSAQWIPEFPASAKTVGIDWNVTIPTGLPGSANVYYVGDRIIGSYINRIRPTEEPIVSWGLSLKPGQQGQLMFNTTWQPPQGALELSFAAASIDDRVFTVRCKELRAFFGFNMDNGQYLWGPTESRGYMDWYMGGPSGENGMIAYGMLYLGTVAGALQGINVKTGELLWTYNMTQPYTELMWGGSNWPIEFAFASDGKIYLLHTEHSGNSPLPRGGPFVCLNGTTGEVIFRADGLLRFTVWGGDPMIADSTAVIFNTYDNHIYAVGKGPSATTVTAPKAGLPLGSSVVISGSVTDVSAGALEYARTSRFPNGVPAVSDESVGEWMKYVYQQFPRPTDATGVEVTISVVDENGNYREIGKTTSSSDGFYSLAWAPDIPGKYMVYASFAGSESYWSSHAETAFVVDEAVPPEQEPGYPPQVDYTWTIVGVGLAVLAAVVIVGVVLALLMRKRS